VRQLTSGKNATTTEGTQMNIYKITLFKGRYHTIEILAEDHATAINLGLAWNENSEHVRYGKATSEPANYIESVEEKYSKNTKTAPAENFEEMEKADRERITAALEIIRKSHRQGIASNYYHAADVAIRDIEELISSRIFNNIA
jgi:hypothetical protein